MYNIKKYTKFGIFSFSNVLINIHVRNDKISSNFKIVNV